VYEWCQKLDDGGYFVLTETLTKLIAGAILSTCLANGWDVVVHLCKYFAVLPFSSMANGQISECDFLQWFLLHRDDSLMDYREMWLVIRDIGSGCLHL